MSVPNSVTELAKARQTARANKDFALADSLRDQIFAAGYEVADVAGGFELTATVDGVKVLGMAKALVKK